MISLKKQEILHKLTNQSPEYAMEITEMLARFTDAKEEQYNQLDDLERMINNTEYAPD